MLFVLVIFSVLVDSPVYLLLFWHCGNRIIPYCQRSAWRVWVKLTETPAKYRNASKVKGSAHKRHMNFRWSQITGRSTICLTACANLYRKVPVTGLFDRWIPRKKDQWRGKRFHFLMPSCNHAHNSRDGDVLYACINNFMKVRNLNYKASISRFVW